MTLWAENPSTKAQGQPQKPWTLGFLFFLQQHLRPHSNGLPWPERTSQTPQPNIQNNSPFGSNLPFILPTLSQGQSDLPTLGPQILIPALSFANFLASTTSSHPGGPPQDCSTQLWPPFPPVLLKLIHWEVVAGWRVLKNRLNWISILSISCLTFGKSH